MALESFLPLAGAGLGALLEGDEPPGLTPEQRRIWKMLIDRYQAEHRYSNSPTMSTPVERQSLAQAQGLQSEMAGRSRQSLFGQQGVTDMANSPQQTRMMGNLAAAEGAQASGLAGQFALQGLQDRFNTKHNVLPGLLGQASGVAGSPAQPGQSGGWGALMPFLQQAAYQWGSKPSSGGTSGTTFGTPRSYTGWSPTSGRNL